ncbi:MAG: PIN domain-containing protein [Candidatus Bathyarchaeia archaeon]|jgi:predicted nucleic acid-binding protein
MNKAVFDTRFFADYYYSKNEQLLNKMRAEKLRKNRYISAVVIHEVYNLAISREGRETAKTQVANILEEFKVVPVDEQIAQVSAELKHKYQLPMGDSMIAATALVLKAVCITDDPHFKQIKEIQTAWI